MNTSPSLLKLLELLKEDEQPYYSDFNNISLGLLTASLSGVVKGWVLPGIVLENYVLDCRRMQVRAGNPSRDISFDINPVFFFRSMPVYASLLLEIPPGGFGLLRIPDKHPAEMSWTELQALAAPGMEHTPE